jgi:hypothetical protein
MAVSLAKPYVTGMTPEKDGRNEDKERAARKTLHELRHEGAEIGGAVSAMAKRTATHFAGDNERDPIELWGKRIGRTLSLIGFVALAIYLYMTYVK